MRGVAHDAVLRAKLMAQHEAGVPWSVLSARHGIARPVLSRWWARYQTCDLAGLQPQSRRPHRSPTRHVPAVAETIDAARDFGWGVAASPTNSGLAMAPWSAAVLAGAASDADRGASRHPLHAMEYSCHGETFACILAAARSR